MDITSTLEIGAQVSYASAADPFNLSSKLKPATEVQQPEANTSRKRALRYNPFGKKNSQLRGVTEFYTSQNEKIKSFLKPVDEHVREHAETAAFNKLPYRIAVYSSFVCNIFLSGLQLYGAIASGSLSLLPLALSPSSQRWPTRYSIRYRTSP